MRFLNRNGFAIRPVLTPRSLFPTVSLAPAQDSKGAPCLALMLGLAPISLYYPKEGTMVPMDSDAEHFLGALNFELDLLTNPNAQSTPDIYALDAFLLGLLQGMSPEIAFCQMVEFDRANRLDGDLAPYHRTIGLT